MSDNEGTPDRAGKQVVGWTDREKLCYLVLCMDSAGKINFDDVPLPAGRSAIACRRMVERLKGQLKGDIERMKSGQPLSDEAGGTKKAATPRKKKAEGEEGTPKTPGKRKVKQEGEEDGSPKKRGRKKKETENLEAGEIKTEVKEEPEVEQEAEIEI
ncbi:hypothetical protein K469DRAFT_698929 [Zopfia rhizophila CBS 207.26]|uniref:Uncharacterized protein n=1 Tax=Zopfia rhizophila CBS 207.26 TaxID=1314779 RepID=A0A6A6EZK7_9PEZI|nr:hypothetical protein K469DRAFT_698929 [Zopfia rhizophila CBS 207.26]